MGMLDRDWIVRLTKEIARVLAAALRLNQQKQHDAAVQELEGACGPLLGIDFRTLAYVDAASAASLLGDAARIEAFASLLEALAQTHAASGDLARAASRRQHTLELSLEVLARAPAHAAALARVGQLRAEVDPAALPARARALLTAIAR